MNDLEPRPCATKGCGKLFSTEFNQQKYCTECVERRKNLLKIIGLLKASVTKDLRTVLKDAHTEFKYLDGKANLLIDYRGEKCLRVKAGGFNEFETLSIIKKIFSCWKHLIKNREKFNEIFNEGTE
jgi:hypothetical protein